MKVALILLAILPFIVQASLQSYGHHHLARRDHSRLARHANSPVLNKRCPKRNRKNSSANASSTSTSTSDNSGEDAPSGDVNSHSTGMLNVKSSCGDIVDIRATSGPNGKEDWLNCGLHDAGGWRPPFVTVEELITKDLGEVLKSNSGAFGACREFKDLFERHANANGIPPILLAAFALQESSCNPDATGGAGEQGIMQITKDKCGGAPGGNCKDPDFNINAGAKFFTKTLRENDNNVILTIGMYNGWSKGLTFEKATAAGKGSCCRCQNNLDYIHQFVNGWLQGFNVYGGKVRLGSYFNLDKCN